LKEISSIMRHIIFVLSFLLSQNLCVLSQENTTSSLLWKISGKNMTGESYLFGTMHVQDETVFHMEDMVKKYILLCDAFAMEVLLDEINPVAAQSQMIMKNTTLKELLSAEDYLFLDEYMKEKLGQGVLMFNKMKPFFLSAQLMQIDMAKDKALPMDMEFLDYARKNGKSVIGLERFEDQIRAVDKISLEDQASMLMDMVRDTLKENSNMEQLMSAYIAQDIELLYSITVSDTSLPANFQDIFLTRRNSKMVQQIIRFSKHQSVVYAVGAAHLGGPGGIIALLRKKGYLVEAVSVSY
jgi:uncharacterized protein